MARLLRPAGITRQPLLLFVFSLFMLLGAMSLPASAQENGTTPTNQSLSLPAYGVTLQVPAGWSHRHYANVDELLNLTPQQMAKMSPVDRENSAKIRVNAMKRRSHSLAVARLGLVAAEYATPPTFLTIDGWPALQRQTVVAKPQRGQEQDSEKENSQPPPMQWLVTTAVAAGSSVFRLDGTIPANLPTANQVARQMEAIGTQLRFQSVANPGAAAADLQQLQDKTSLTPAPLSGPVTPARKQLSAKVAPAASSQAGIAFYNTGVVLAEPEIAVSPNGQNIVIASQFYGVSSQNGGQSFSSIFNFPNSTGGDSSLAYGRSGNFYEGTIGTVNTQDDSQVVNISTTGGQSFQFGTNPFICSSSTCDFVSSTFPDGVPDQEHIGADRVNAGPPPTAGDQVYFVWRKPNGYGISCSSNSGKTWTPAAFNGDGSADFPRVSVGEDGTVYVVYVNGGNLELDQYTSCANGLVENFQGAVAASSTTQPLCPIAGLDRCGGETGQNDLRSTVIAVDDTNANHVYLGFASNTSSSTTPNENVYVTDSYSQGADGTWSAPTEVNNSIPAHRFMPWTCSVGGDAYVSWFDRRNATSVTNDDTDYFASSATPNGSGNAVSATPDYQVNYPGTSDPQCGYPVGGGGNWPRNPAATNDSTSCYATPQLAGTCSSDGITRCDYNSPPSACGTCQIGTGGPKYGDYNGNACGAGRLYTVWGTATSQPSSISNAPASGINLFFTQQVVCCVPQIQLPGPISLTACAGSTANTTVNLCNTGKADLQINTISSSNPDITVSTPTSGYPLTVSPDSCFPEQVTLTPGTTTGPVTGTLTVSSNDTVNPSATIQVNGNSPAPSINASIVNSGNFGNVCPAGQANLNLNVTNQSSCNLVINSITTTADFLRPTVGLPLTLTADATIALPLTFAPSASQACSNTSPINGFVTLNSNDPTQPGGNTVVGLSGKVPCPKIAATIPNGGKFGNLCSSQVADLNLEVLNTGACNLNISSISSSSPQFALPTNPLVLSPDANVDLPVAFQPAPYGSPGYVTCSNTTPETSNITIVSNDPTHPVFVTPVQGIEGCPTMVLGPLNLTGLNDYPPTVSDPTGTLGCYTDKQITVSNTGICPLIIPRAGTVNGLDGKGRPLPASPLEYNVVNTSFPITLAPAAKPVPITVRFKPEILTDQNPTAPDQQTGTLNIVSNDPVVTDNTSALCGEPVYHSGARILLENTLEVPLSSVTELRLTTQDIVPTFLQKLSPAPLQPPANVCGNTIYYHLDNETLNPTGSNPNAYYVVLVNNNPHYFEPRDFRLNQCQFQQIVMEEKY
jgi:hypothetical protein